MIFKPKKRESPYTQVDKGVINDQKLSWKAKGILVYLLSKPEDWIVNVIDIIKHASDGRESVYSGITELISAGYIVRDQEHDEHGRFKDGEYKVYEIPQAQEPHVKRDCPVYGTIRKR